MLDQKIHRKIMFEILRNIYSSDLGFILGFKGGTMLYFFYNLERFSIDLDFDLLDAAKENIVLKKIEKILKPYGKISDIYNKNYTLFALLNYKDGERNLKIEISKRTVYQNKYEFKNLYGTDIKCMTIEDSFAHKLLAATGRRTAVNRDFFDLYFFWKNGYEFNQEIIKKATKKSIKEYLKFLRAYVEKNLNQKNVLQGLGELVSVDQKNWIKKNLKQELLNYIDFNLKI
ncbi:nucleotidyl transferase AbiEii/AbiGii toxin family protein [Candidatus Parcubacteria bacterium]|nr:nucleotidyl transferase AbiEii/AbiGii toxin family protein [Candidatus Parcubacteria bacterium]